MHAIELLQLAGRILHEQRMTGDTPSVSRMHSCQPRPANLLVVTNIVRIRVR